MKTAAQVVLVVLALCLQQLNVARAQGLTKVGVVLNFAGSERHALGCAEAIVSARATGDRSGGSTARPLLGV